MKTYNSVVSYAQRLLFWRKKFQAAGLTTAGLDARYLLLFAAKMDAAQLISADQNEIPADVSAAFDGMGERRLKGEPVARILGEKEFFGHNFLLNKDTLVPRPETELIVDIALERFPSDGRLLDLGTGSGAIAITILLEFPDAIGTAVDISKGALDCARENAIRHGVEDRLTLLQGSWFEPVEAQKFDLIISNPPYIGLDERNEMNAEALGFDPQLALFADEGGLAAYKSIIDRANEYLAGDGWLILEIGYRQADVVSKLLSDNGFDEIAKLSDLSGHDRALLAQR
ncbi:peptide chain release factor N(5)-glutamine methyltransferase [uncultured Maritalea sp.]|jgi:release factor glutamine methyltransferase|uniref:peptide chain release factor N(5)-glutamine methyltransferase n=1 Tax=uncultured Maritalea sp. TaxID=757249 RepID=UPI0026176621|nr:peptide chain release factor N(5)-glutamine methyltransferase [uncultured Maritalea sp.]